MTHAIHAHEVARVTQHIARAEQLAAARDLSNLTHLQRILRQLLLRALALYRADGRFPHNRGDFADKTPYFVDASGTRCAMAHLLELGGEHDLVAKIARERNHAYVRELADEPRLLAWLEAVGFTVDEAAAIQPAYCSIASDCICGGDFSHVEYPLPARGVLEGVVLESGAARVERTYGDALGIAVGSEVSLEATHPTGTRVLVPIDSATETSYASVALDFHGIYNCSSQGVSDAPPLTAEEFADAVLANDCAGTLRAMDDAWARGSEDCGGGGNVENDGGCNASGAESFSLGVLLVLVATLARRR